MLQFFFKSISEINEQIEVYKSLFEKYKHNDDTNLSDIDLPNEYKVIEMDDEGKYYEIIYELDESDKYVLRLEYMIYQLSKDNIKDKEYIEKNLTPLDFYVSQCYAKYDNYLEKEAMNRAKQKMR